MLSTRGLVKVYPGPVTALNGIDLDVPAGMFGLLGPNGAGKSTFMKILAGLLEPTSGTVTLDGADILEDPRTLWPRLGYLPQEFGFYPHLSGEAMLSHLLTLKGVDAPQGRKRLVADLLDRVNLSFAAKRAVKGYSGGMRQRLGIAQALAGDPRLIIVDEPTAGLDPEERLRFYHLLSELAVDRIVLLSTHIVEDVAVLCPRFALIRDGRLLAVTSPSEARASIDGHMFEGTVHVEDLPRLRAERTVTQALLVEGRNRARIYDPSEAPPDGFIPAPVTLEDAYLVLMRLGALPARGNGSAGRPPLGEGARSLGPAAAGVAG
ncbi:MAG: ATP-binding cassette domain-containing protein [Candidatus Eisenbacteria bacterium]|uniref:ATP-binding cassette domain-containing protein n=1 Tax=Eiseniibacteriota bacterium TaxID=2212470 RepID=A0A538T983_UNCEI|nr:MAG: ATP-binding cassette domain-containing protein [Candidatus Eisenbacteria bacterium]